MVKNACGSYHSPGGSDIESDNFLEARNLRKSFGDLQAVDGVSFDIRRGEIFGLLGPNGAGKTTVIRMLSTVLRPDDGDATIDGRSVSAQGGEARKLIGVCPQELALYPELSATDNLVFFGRMAGLGGRAARKTAAGILESVGLSERAKDKVDNFSGGMKAASQHRNRADEQSSAAFPGRAHRRHRSAVA